MHLVIAMTFLLAIFLHNYRLLHHYNNNLVLNILLWDYSHLAYRLIKIYF